MYVDNKTYTLFIDKTSDSFPPDSSSFQWRYQFGDSADHLSLVLESLANHGFVIFSSGFKTPNVRMTGILCYESFEVLSIQKFV